MNEPLFNSGMMARIDWMFHDYESALLSLSEDFRQFYKPHPLETAIRYSFFIDDAIQILNDENTLQKVGIEYLQGRKSRLDDQFVKILADPIVRNSAIFLTNQFIKARMEDYQHYLSFLPPSPLETGDDFPELLSKRTSLESLITYLQNMGEDVSDYRDKFLEFDNILKRLANRNWISENTSRNRVLNLMPPNRWWWYREYYSS